MALANPFGPARRGREAVIGALDHASSRMSDGQVVGFDEVARYTSDELATILEVEHWHARIGERESVEPFDLRVTTTFRRENGAWKIVHRHADPISTEDGAGPLRRRRSGSNRTASNPLRARCCERRMLRPLLCARHHEPCSAATTGNSGQEKTRRFQRVSWSG